jgi:hypothetical protein
MIVGLAACLSTSIMVAAVVFAAALICEALWRDR